MELRDAIARRRMVRSFTGDPVDVDALTAMCQLSLYAPTAGNAAGVAMVVVTAERVAEFFTVATDEAWRTRSKKYSGLSRAGAVVLVCSEPARYTERYSEPDKIASGLGNPAAWPVPYWHTDAAMATMSLLLLVEEAGLAATIWGAFRHEDDILEFGRAPVGSRLFASVLIGRSDGNDAATSSLRRDTPSRAERVFLLGRE